MRELLKTNKAIIIVFSKHIENETKFKNTVLFSDGFIRTRANLAP